MLTVSNAKFYDSIYELPISRSIEMRKYLNLNQHYGCTLADLAERYRRISLFEQHGKEAYAEQEKIAAEVCKHFIKEKVDLPLMALACLVYSVDGKPTVSITESALKETIAALKLDDPRQTLKQISETIGQERRMAFPDYQLADEREDAYTAYVRGKWRHLRGRTEDRVPKALLNRWLESIAPVNYHPGDAESEYHEAVRSFERSCTLMMLNEVERPREMTEYAFYQTRTLLLERNGRKSD